MRDKSRLRLVRWIVPVAVVLFLHSGGSLRAEGPAVDHPLLAALRTFARESQAKHPNDLLDIGLGVEQDNAPGNYGCSPRNGIVFARTGGDGDHFSLLAIDGRITEKSPVVLSWPSEDVNIVVAPDLKTFLAVGLHCGYFQFLTVHEAKYSKRTGAWFGDEVNREQQRTLRMLGSALGLEPLAPGTIDRKALERAHLHRIERLDGRTQRPGA